MFRNIESCNNINSYTSNSNNVYAYLTCDEQIFNFDYNKTGDSLELSNKTITPSGTNSHDVLKNAPSPEVKIGNETKIVRIIVDTKNNHLYTYNEYGEPQMAYLIASGKPSTPTNKGLRYINHYEKYPYSSATNTKRKKNPDAYGPHIMYLREVNQNTGKVGGSNGEFIHGNNDIDSLGKHASGGCIRMDNDVIKQLVNEIPKGSYVLIK